jgi:hypothetical protein
MMNRQIVKISFDSKISSSGVGFLVMKVLKPSQIEKAT